MLVAGLAAALLVAAPGAALGDGARRVIFISLDGAADWMLDRFLDQGKAPAFAALARDGAMAEAAISTVPSLTSAGHAAIWTGAPPSRSGVAGNRVLMRPPAEHSILELMSGFESPALRAEPIWMTAARQGRRALVLQASGAYPFPQPPVPGALLFDVYSARLAAAQLVTASLTDGHYTLETPAGPLTLEAIEGGALRIGAGDQSGVVTPRADGAWTPPIRARVGDREGAFSAGLLDYSPMTGAFMLVRGEILRLASSDPAQVEPFLAAAGTLVDEGAFVGWYYRERLGPTLPSAGTGRAEERLVALAAASQSYFTKSLAYAADRPWDLLVCYTPTFDQFAHALAGLVDPDSSRYVPGVADRAWEYLERAFALTVDGYVADVRRLFPDATVVITSDHGMEGTARVVYPNVILRHAGLLALDMGGKPDLVRTKAVVLDDRGGAVTINVSARRGGVVSEAERRAVKQQVVAAMLAVRDPETGVAPIRAVFDADVDGEALGFDAADGVDLVIDPSPDYAIVTTATSEAITARSNYPTGEGRHGPVPTRRRLQGIFFAAGPGVAPGVRLPIISVTDVAPTVASLLGISPPAQATGRALPIGQ